MGLTSPYLWYATRATGTVALVLFTLVVTLGTLVATRVGGTAVGRFEINELHRSLSVVALVFLGLHIMTTLVDSYVPTGLISVIVPFTSAYKRVAVGAGAVALDLMLAVWLSSLVKARTKNTTWRFIHWFSWLAFATSIVHAITAGTDTRNSWGLALVATCCAVVAAAGVWRGWRRPARAAGRTALSPLARGPGPRLTPDVAQRPTSPQSSPAPTRVPGAFPRSPRTPPTKRAR